MCEENKQDASGNFSEIYAAYLKGDAEAGYIVARMALEGRLRVPGDTREYGMRILCRLADRGHVPSRIFLNDLCRKRYGELIPSSSPAGDTGGPLTDFSGKRIKIDRKGVLTPIDAELSFVDGVNVLTLSTRLCFLSCDNIENEEPFRGAVIAGVKDWEGDYEVFGGQKLRLRINVTVGPEMFDSVIIYPVTESADALVRRIASHLPSNKRTTATLDMLDTKRSFAALFRKWSVYSRKIIYIQSEDGYFSDYPELRAVAKHEFGHALGLGDLYESESDSLEGIAPGTYPETDAYYLYRRFYNLVMCDHHAPVSNNDIEMVVLAFSENEMQLYQKYPSLKGKISEALGKGN